MHEGQEHQPDDTSSLAAPLSLLMHFRSRVSRALGQILDALTTRRQPWQVPTTSRRLARGSPWIVGLVLLALAFGCAGTSITVGLTVRDLNSVLKDGTAHVTQAESLGKQLSGSPLDTATLSQLRDELAAADVDFRAAQQDAARLAPGSIIPGIGTKVSDAQALLVMVTALTGGGADAITAALPVVESLKSALAPSASASATPTPSPQPTAPSATPSLTSAELVALQKALRTFAQDLAAAAGARLRITDNGASLGSSVAHLLSRYDSLVGGLDPLLADAGVLVTAAPVLLGTDQPANYLVEILDATELRGGGGFVGNYGVLNVTGGHVGTVNVRDSYLLDLPYLATHTRPFPPAYTWFDLARSMGLRDSNLSPDFPFNAQLAEQVYSQESGESVVGVAAITPDFIGGLLALTGPVLVPGYNVTVTSENLIATIHHYQFLTSDQGVPSSDGLSSTRKHFTAVLGGAVLAKVRQLPQSALHQLLTLASDSLKNKNLQLYLNDAASQAVLSRVHVANTLTPAPGTTPSDMLALVDNDISANKAYLYVTQSATDQVAVQLDGTARHTLSVQYAYHPTGDVFGYRNFVDEVQIFVPAGSTLIAHSGLDVANAPNTAYGRAVFGGQLALAPGQRRTVKFSWIAPASVAGTRAYTLWLTRQPGSACAYSMVIQLPPTATRPVPTAPLAPSSTGMTYTTTGPMETDQELQVRWS